MYVMLFFFLIEEPTVRAVTCEPAPVCPRLKKIRILVHYLLRAFSDREMYFIIEQIREAYVLYMELCY